MSPLAKYFRSTLRCFRSCSHPKPARQYGIAAIGGGNRSDPLFSAVSNMRFCDVLEHWAPTGFVDMPIDNMNWTWILVKMCPPHLSLKL